MNRLFAQMCEKHMPKLNPLIMEGLACTYLSRVEEYADRAARSAFHGVIEGLEYVGIERCTPEEEYQITTKIKNNRRQYDLAKSDIYLVKVKLRFQGIDLPDRHLFLPYCRPGGLIYLGGSLFHFTPVLSDKVISPCPDSIFVRLLQYKLKFYRVSHAIVANGEKQTVPIVHSLIYNQKKENRKVPISTKAVTCLVHYLMAKFGFTGAFQKYLGFTPVVGGEEINSETYPSDNWVIVQTAYSALKPPSFIGDTYKGTSIRLAVPIHCWNNDTRAFVSGFFYAVDHFPSYMMADWVDNTQCWQIILAYILFGNAYSSGSLYSRVSEHFTSLDSYVDSQAIEKLAEKGYTVNNFFDLLSLLATRYNELSSDNSQSSSMYGKYLDVLYYAMLPITTSMFTTKFALMKMATKSQPTYDRVKDTFIRKFNPGPVFKLSSDGTVTETVSYSGDHLYFKLTSKITEQESGPSGGRGGKGGARKSVGEDKHLNTSMIEGGSILFLSKSNAVPTNRINPFAIIDTATGTIVQNPKLKERLAYAEELLSRK